jgi:hypothetical protein
VAAATLGALVGLGPLAGCSLTSLDGLTGGDGVDGAAPPGDGADATDSAAGSDAARDGAATTDSGADAAPFCASRPPDAGFCDDFERADPRGPWKRVVESNGGAVAIEPMAGGSRALHASMPLVTSGGVVQARLEQPLGHASRVRWAFRFEADAFPTVDSGVQLMAIYGDLTGGAFFTIYLFVRPSGVSIVDQTFPADASATSEFHEHPLDPPVTAGAPHDLVVDAALTSPARLTVTVDGATSFDGAISTEIDDADLTLSAGIHYATPTSGPLSLRVDDLAVDLTP